MSRLATVIGALSAIVTLADYLAAKSFLSDWLHHQIRRDSEGWRISPTLNLLFMAALAGVVWLLTDSPATDPPARKRLLGLRTKLILLSLGAWFFFGPSIGAIEDAPQSSLSAAPAGDVLNGHAAAGPAAVSPAKGPGDARIGAPSVSHGHTSQFTWQPGARPSPAAAWRPGDGLRAMARLLEDVTAPPAQANR